MKERFKDIRFKPQSLQLINQCSEIIHGYAEAGLRLSLRQLYYQLVSRNVVTNHEKSYKMLSGLISDARLAGLVDWNAIEDRVRVPRVPVEFADLGELVEAAVASYRLPRWQNQDCYVELWVEKDALAGVLAPIAREYHITLMVNRGYSSQSAMYESAQRFLHHPECQGVLLYLGDHDPSGEDMVRDIRDRLELFGAEVSVIKVALTTAQVEEHRPPPNPAKVTDPRAAAYIATHGNRSWEVDALPPDVLQMLIVTELRRWIDMREYESVIEREAADKKLLRTAVRKLKK